MHSKEQGIPKSPYEANHHLSRLATVGQISAGIAHEIRNPLTAVKGFLQLLKEQTSHKYLDIASVELDRAISALQNLLQVSKPDLDDEAFNEIKLCNELEAILFLFQDQIYRVHIEKDFHDVNETILGKRNQLKKALFNLLKNAFEAIPDKGSIVIGHRREGDRIIVTIKDSGVGIPEDCLGMLGTPFYTTKSEGTGMGLTQVYSTIYQHNAEIEVVSHEGDGTSFILAFPVVKGASPVVEESVDSPYDSIQTWKVFLHDNKDAFRQDVLAAADSELVSANGGGLKIEFMPLRKLTEQLVDIALDDDQQQAAPVLQSAGRELAAQGVALPACVAFMSRFRRIFLQHTEKFFHQAGLTEMGEFNNWILRFHQLLDSFVEEAVAYCGLPGNNEAANTDDDPVPLIFFGRKAAIIPLVGALSEGRARKIREIALTNAARGGIDVLVFDWSGLVRDDSAVHPRVCAIMEAVHLLGCAVAVTGIRQEIAETMVDLGLSFKEYVQIHPSPRNMLEQH